MDEHRHLSGLDGIRDGQGRFIKGNPGGPGNPGGSRARKLRFALLDACAPEDFEVIARRLIEDSKAGSVQAAKELFDRTLGRPESIDLLQRIDELEALVDRLSGMAGAT